MKLRAVGRTLIAAGLAMSLLSAAPVAAQQQDQVCTEMDSGKIDVTGDVASVTVTAPEGFLIDSYCAKAGSANQGLGPEYYTVEPPQESVTITHSSGKDLSHYSYGLVSVDPTTTTTLPEETTTTTVPDTTTTTVPDETTTTTLPKETTTTTEPESTTTTTTVPDSTTTTTVPEDEPECTEDHPTYNAETGKCELPFTGPMDLLPIFILGLMMTGGGIIMVRAAGENA